MAVADAVTPQFQMGRVIRRMFSVIPNNIVSFALLSLLPGLSSATIELAQSQIRIAGGYFGAPARGPIALLVGAAIVYLVSWVLLQGAVVHGAVASFNGRRASIGDCFATSLKNFVPLVLIGVIATVAILAAALFFLVPGIIVALMWFVAIPVCVVEHTGIGGSLNRSSELTRGYRWSILGVCVAYFVAALIFLLVFGALIGVGLVATSNVEVLVETDGAQLLALVGETISTMASTIVLSALVASVYYELRQIKEGIGPEALASVFD
jgi:hypothetical protein